MNPMVNRSVLRLKMSQSPKPSGKYLSARRPDRPSWNSVRAIRALSPAEAFIGSFMGLVIAGTLALKLLPNLYTGPALDWTNALFTATSAVCVTGLIVVDTGTYFTFAGQVVLLVLIQLGGLGMLVLTSVVIRALGGRPSMRTDSITATSRSVLPHIPTRTMIMDVVALTVLCELLGAIVLWVIWLPELGWRGAIWPAIFHAVSAFCNAGFSTHSDSLMGYQHSPATLLVVSLIIIVGGIGFVVIEELYRRRQPNLRVYRKLSVHTQLVLTTTAILIVVPWLFFAMFEWHGVLKNMSIVDKLANALFLSVTPRTAGFNSIDYAKTSESSNFLTILLMMIGGSPGSTAGGMKTTTFVLLVMQAWSRLRANETVTFAKRSIPSETIQRASGLFIITTGMVAVGVLLMSSTGDCYEAHPDFMTRLFEVVSAFNTVGLSMGITAELSLPSRWILIVLMFIGRTGPLVVAAALVVRFSRGGKFRLAYEDVIVG